MVNKYHYTHIYKHPFADVTLAYEKRFISDVVPEIKDVKVVRGYFNRQNNVVLERELTVEPSIPGWVAFMVGVDSAIVEHVLIKDDTNKKMSVRIRNKTLSYYVNFEEIGEFTEDPDNPNYTLYKQTSTLQVDLSNSINKILEYHWFKNYKAKHEDGTMSNYIYRNLPTPS